MHMAGQRMKMKNSLPMQNNVFQTLKKIIECGREQICSLLFPLRCPVCDDLLSPEDMEKGIHLECESKLYPVEGAVCMHCGRPLGQLSSHEQGKTVDSFLEIGSSQEFCGECCRKGYVITNARNGTGSKKLSNITQGKSLYVYKGAIKQSMYRFKYSNKREYAKFFACQAVSRYGDWIKADAIVPVPMYPVKQKQRGYNQAEVLAEELSRFLGVPVDKNLVQRVKNTVPQKGLNHVERENNLKKAFQKGKSIVKYSCILIIDDIFTTGSTAEAVAKELKKQGVRHIYYLSICIGGDT